MRTVIKLPQGNEPALARMAMLEMGRCVGVSLSAAWNRPPAPNLRCEGLPVSHAEDKAPKLCPILAILLLQRKSGLFHGSASKKAMPVIEMLWYRTFFFCIEGGLWEGGGRRNLFKAKSSPIDTFLFRVEKWKSGKVTLCPSLLLFAGLDSVPLYTHLTIIPMASSHVF